MILIKLDTCFLCYQQEYQAIECPVKGRLRVRSKMLGREGKEPGRMEFKKEVVIRELPVDIELELELSSYQSIPSIYVFAKVKKMLLWTLIDCGAEEDISECVIKKKNLQTMPI